MENFNTAIDGHKYKTQTEQQGSILSRSFLVTGISFLLICVIGYGFGVLFNKLIYEWNHFDVANTLVYVSILLVIISMIGSMVVMRKLLIQPTWKIVTWIGLYCLGEGLGLGMLFARFNTNSYSLVLIFGICGLVFLICALIGYFLTTRAAFTLARMLMWGAIAIMVLMVIMFIPMIIMLCTGTTMWGFEWYYWLILGLSGLMFMGYIAYDTHVIARTSEFMSIGSSQVINNLSLYFGYRLLVDLIGLLWTIASFVLMGSRRS